MSSKQRLHQGQVAGKSWDPQQYSKFSDQRLRPALDLLNRVPVSDPHSVVDLGCGTGNVTQIMAQRWGTAQVTGVDLSKEMLSKASSAVSASERIEWVEADAREYVPASPPCVLYSNATLHWVDDHEITLPSSDALGATGRMLSGTNAAELGAALAPLDARNAS